MPLLDMVHFSTLYIKNGIHVTEMWAFNKINWNVTKTQLFNQNNTSIIIMDQRFTEAWITFISLFKISIK